MYIGLWVEIDDIFLEYDYSQYRGNLCSGEWCDYLVVIDNKVKRECEKRIKEERKEMLRKESDYRWNIFMFGKTLDEIKEELKDYRFPTKFK